MDVMLVTASMKHSRPALTTLPLAPDIERKRRMIKYSVAMGVRLVCVIVVIFVPGWWALIPAIGAIFLPYFAVVVANSAAPSAGTIVERPGGLLPGTTPRDGTDDRS